MMGIPMATLAYSSRKMKLLSRSPANTCFRPASNSPMGIYPDSICKDSTPRTLGKRTPARTGDPSSIIPNDEYANSTGYTKCLIWWAVWIPVVCFPTLVASLVCPLAMIVVTIENNRTASTLRLALRTAHPLVRDQSKILSRFGRVPQAGTGCAPTLLADVSIANQGRRCQG